MGQYGLVGGALWRLPFRDYRATSSPVLPCDMVRMRPKRPNGFPGAIMVGRPSGRQERRRAAGVPKRTFFRAYGEGVELARLGVGKPLTRPLPIRCADQRTDSVPFLRATARRAHGFNGARHWTRGTVLEGHPRWDFHAIPRVDQPYPSLGPPQLHFYDWES
jgi:hypothetical protein